MIPLVDTHCHLMAGMDDGPKTWDEVLTMCRIAVSEGTQLMAATAHQNEHWPDVTPAKIRAATQYLATLLQQEKIPITVVPSAEVMAHLEMDSSWENGELLSVGDHSKYILIEMPHEVFVDITPLIEPLKEQGIQLILAHPERHPEWLHQPGAIEEMIDLGCLVQVSTGSITNPQNRVDSIALKDWFRRGCVHLIGSDGHSPGRRSPRMAAAYDKVSQWVGTAMTDRVFSTNGLAILQGRRVRVAQPKPQRAWWIPSIWK